MDSSSGDSWVKKYNEALKLFDDINGIISEKTHLSILGSESQLRFSATPQMITALNSKLEDLSAKTPSKHLIAQKELNRRQDMLSNLRSKANQMAATLKMSKLYHRDILHEPQITVADLDNQGVVVLQRQIIREQDSGLEKLAETIRSTNQIALAVNEQLTLHTRLVDSADIRPEHTGSQTQRLRSLEFLRRRDEGKGCCCQLQEFWL